MTVTKARFGLSGLTLAAALITGGCGTKPEATPSAQVAAPPADGSDPASANLAPAVEAEAQEPPPPLPEYTQPECPGENYIWTPGVWNYATTGYYWVPGTWVMAPFVGALWTPPYWGYQGSRYVFHRGYWGPHIGFYGGINYGFGYIGRGYEGGYWNNNVFAYNRAVTNVNTSVVHNVYNRAVVNNSVNRISYNGGRGGIEARPVAAEQAVLREHIVPPVAAQIQHERQAAPRQAEPMAQRMEARPEARPENRPAPMQHAAPVARPEPAARPESHGRPEPGARPAGPENRPAPVQHAGPAARPEPGARPESHGRPEPGARPAGPETRPAPMQHAAPVARPEPGARPAALAPRQEAHPGPGRPEEKRGPEKKEEKR